MQVRVLGCSGGIGGALRTTSMLVDHDILIDAGTGVGDLTVEEMMAIDHIFVTHAHLDHIACIPLLLDTVIGLREGHVTLHASCDTWPDLRKHVFNWKIWPDFNEIPDVANPFLRYSEIRVGETITLDGRCITPLPANHAVPAVGFRLDSGSASLVFSGDTTTCDALWQAVNSIENLKYLIIEVAFSNADLKLARVSKHLCPSLLLQELQKLQRQAEIYITHLKPGEAEVIMQEIVRDASIYAPMPLQQGQVLDF